MGERCGFMLRTCHSATVGERACLGIGPIRMPDYLDRSQMVMLDAGQEIRVDEYNRWAEPLSPAFHRIVGGG